MATTGGAPMGSRKFAIRGGEEMKAEELTGHLALALRLENIGLLLGAGASVSAGGKTIGQLWKGLEAWHDPVADRQQVHREG
jgi:hypothetical protein